MALPSRRGAAVWLLCWQSGQLAGAEDGATERAKQLRIVHVNRVVAETHCVEQGPCAVPVIAQVDVVVAGGGVAGVTAALQAAGEGLSVVLVEPRNYFGYELAAPELPTTTPHEPNPDFALADGLCRQLSQEEAFRGERVNPYRLKASLHRMVADQARIKPYLFSWPCGVVMEGNAVRGLVMANRSGRQIVLARAVVDATADARVAAAAGATFIRTLRGQKTVKRTISLSNHNPLTAGVVSVPKDLGFIDNQVRVLGEDSQVIEFALPATIGEDIAGDLSEVQAASLDRGISLLEYFERTPKAFRNGQIDTERPFRDRETRYRFGPEIFVCQGPVVACRKSLTPVVAGPPVVAGLPTEPLARPKVSMNGRAFDLAMLADSDTCRPKGIDGIVIAGRTVAAAQEMADLQALACSGEHSGRVAVEIARKSPAPAITSVPDASATSAVRIAEILAGPDPSIPYPMLRQEAVKLPVIQQADVVVVGGGTSGAPAAIAAARQGAKVVLVEILPNLGGTGSNRVNGYYWGVTWRSELSQEINDRTHTWLRIREKHRFNGEEKKVALQELALAAGVKIYYGTLAAGAVMEGDKITGVVVENAAGRQVILAKMVIDANGNGDIAAAAGASFTKGRTSDGFLHEVDRNGLRDPTNVEDMTAFLMKRPSSSIALNIRESRLITGDYVVTFEDSIHGRNFTDLICRWRSNYDTHFPNSASMSDLAQDWVALLGLWRRPIVGNIPYRSILPKGIENLLAVGKSFSVDHDTNLGARMQRDLQHLGEAAGVAAALAVRYRTSAREVPIEKLQNELILIGVLRDEDLEAIHAPPPEFDPASAAAKLGTAESLEAMVGLYMAGEASVPALRPLLESDNSDVRADAALLLGMLGNRSAVPQLLRCLKERNPRTHRFTLVDCSSRSSVPMWYASAILLGRLREKAAAPLLMDVLQDPDACPPDLVSFAIVALERIGDPIAGAAIKPYLKIGESAPMDNENQAFELKWGVRTNAARALARLGDTSGVPVLIELLGANQSLARDYAQRLLKEITGQNFGKDRQRWQAWWDEHGVD
ncbi:MAG: FAD-dependent oxidoreductase [Pirellulaceae bacterium]|nr:FAD-dependent oxidoreductase [Pirellulaceae bacterium]